MKISVIQPNIIWENKSANFKNLDVLISPLYNKTDIIILPEMFNTGFSMNPLKLSESPGSETFRWMKESAVKGNFGICGSYIVGEKNKFFNRWTFVSPGMEIHRYDKRHLFRMGNEENQFTAGKSRLIFEFRDIRISPYICYDLRFPVWSRSRNEYDLAIYSANWPDARNEVWKTLLRARAMENQCYVAGSNRTGIDGSGIKYCGDSLIISPKGEIIGSGKTNEECTLTAELSISELNDFRNKFPVFKDADEFTIKF
jgi:omega-amidase